MLLSYSALQQDFAAEDAAGQLECQEYSAQQDDLRPAPKQLIFT